MKQSSFSSSRSLTQSGQISRVARLAGLSCTALIALPVLVAHADETMAAKPAASHSVERGAIYNLALGKTVQLHPVGNWSFRIEEGAEFVEVAAQNGDLIISPRRAGGRASILVESAGRPAQRYSVRVYDPASAPISIIEDAPITRNGQSLVTMAVAAQTLPATDGSTDTVAAGTPATGATDTGATAADTAAATPSVETAETTTATTTAATTSELNSTPASTTGLTVPNAIPTTPGNSTGVTLPGTPPSVDAPAAQNDIASTTSTTPVIENTSESGTFSPSLPAPSRLPAGKAPFPTQGNVPARVQSAASKAPRNAVTVTQGLARLLQFQRNILAVFFSDVNVMDARAVNARTVAITGLGPGTSTLAVFTERFPGDAVGHANIYQIRVSSNAPSLPTNTEGNATPAPPVDPTGVETAIRTALDDPRINVSVIQLPGGTLAAKLSGVVRDPAEVEGARSTAGLFVPQVISSIYVEKTASARTELNSQPDGGLQDMLRRVTENQTIEVLPAGDGVILKAVVASPLEADAILSLIPLKTRVTPFFVVRGANSEPGTYYNAPRPSLSGEDAEITDRLQMVTGIRSVYAVRTGINAIAVYGTVRNRAEYDTVQRYTALLPQVKQDATNSARGTDGQVAIPAGIQDNPQNFPAASYNFPRSIQMFVRILDDSQSIVRKVTVATNIVEINRTALRNLGVSFGSASLLTEQVTPANGTQPAIINRTINPTLNEGTLLYGNGFIGLDGGLRSVDPFRARLNALYNKGNARILSSPNVTALDGATAQIVVGGSRPIPVTAIATGGGVGQSVTFRRYGIIMTMRPTVTSDDTIILQIRADVTNIDESTAVTVGTATVPGETVRSVDTTINVREGDIIVMGGLITNERSTNTSKIPVLGDLPIIGSLFTSKRFQNNETELAIFMTPTIIRTQADPNTIIAGITAPSQPPLPGINEAGGGLGVIRDQGLNAGGQ